MYFQANEQTDMCGTCSNACNLCDQQKNITWRRRPQEPKHAVNHWRDFDGAKMEFVFQKDLYIKDWLKTRRRREACLPIYYGTGIQRPKDNYDYAKYWRMLADLEKLKDKKKKIFTKKVTRRP